MDHIYYSEFESAEGYIRVHTKLILVQLRLNMIYWGQQWTNGLELELNAIQMYPCLHVMHVSLYLQAAWIGENPSHSLFYP